VITYFYDAQANVTVINGSDVYPGKLDYKLVHEMYDTLVFEIIKSDPIIAIPNGQEDQANTISA
jgi:hypothetical protein